MRITSIALTMALCVALTRGEVRGQANGNTWKVKKTADFEVTGRGSAANWDAVEWTTLTRRGTAGEGLATTVKTLYSDKGMYFLFKCADRKLSAQMEKDFMDLWTEDVVEVFLWPDEALPAYFEYEISPLNRELPILISNEKGDLVRWQPFHYDEDRRTRHETSVAGGQRQSGAHIGEWTAEFFVPFKLLRPLKNIAPQPGTRWRANFYRVDYDEGKASWLWQPTKGTFHDIASFGTLLFE